MGESSRLLPCNVPWGVIMLSAPRRMGSGRSAFANLRKRRIDKGIALANVSSAAAIREYRLPRST